MKWQMQKCKLKLKVGDLEICTSSQVSKRYIHILFFMFITKLERDFSYDNMKLSRNVFHNIWKKLKKKARHLIKHLKLSGATATLYNSMEFYGENS